MSRTYNIVTSDGLDPVREISHILRKPNLPRSSSRDFEKVEEGKKTSSQMWIHTAVEVVYIIYSYTSGLSSILLRALTRDTK